MPLPKELITVTPLSKAVALLLFILLPILSFLLGMNYQNIINNLQNINNQQKACTFEAKICPDGSAVGRSGPNCEFAPCPTMGQQKEVKMECSDARGLKCPAGYVCDTRQFPDASGVCVKVGKEVKEYECPRTEYVDCMPGTFMMKLECTSSYLQWAQENCPGFKGAAY